MRNSKKKITKTELINDINILNKKYDKEIIKFQERLTSIDYIKNENNCILDLRWTYFQTFGKNTLIKMILWYDNEWGYSSKVIDLIKSIFS